MAWWLGHACKLAEEQRVSASLQAEGEPGTSLSLWTGVVTRRLLEIDMIKCDMLGICESFCLIL